MGNFVQSLATGLPIKLNTSVQRVTRDGSGVTVETNKGTFKAKTAILAVSTGVLGANVIEFKPALPVATREAIAALPLGVVYKAALGFKSDIFPQFNGMTSVVPLGNQPAITYFAKFWGYNIVEVLADADLAYKIEGMSRSGQINFLLGRLEENAPGAASAFDGRFTSSNWGHNTFTYGSYSHAKVGMTEARETLRKPVANQLYFAGEAVAQTSTFTLLQGAYNSGIAAASGALKAIGVNLRSRHADAREVRRDASEGPRPDAERQRFQLVHDCGLFEHAYQGAVVLTEQSQELQKLYAVEVGEAVERAIGLRLRKKPGNDAAENGRAGDRNRLRCRA